MSARAQVAGRLLRLAVLLWLAAAGACFAQTVLHESKGPYGEVIVTQERDGLRTLRFERGGARQTVIRPGDPAHLELAYARSMMAGLALVEAPARSLAEAPARSLVVGLGGGSLPMFLRHHYPSMRIDAVDINPQVVDVARRYFDFREDARLRAIVADGRRFIEDAEPGAYDIILLDAYGANSVPKALTTLEFLQAVRRVLAPGGVAVGNVWGRGLNPLYDDMLRTYQEVFDEVVVVSPGEYVNNLVVALPRAAGLTRTGLASRARALAAARGFRFDPGAAVEAGFVSLVERNPASRVLRD